MQRILPILLLIVGSAVGARVLRSWMETEPLRPVAPRLAAAGEGAGLASSEHCNWLLVETEQLAAAPLRSEPVPGRWPAFRGAARDNIARETAPLADSWPADGPPRFWEITLGDGHAGAAIYDGFVYVLDYDETKRRDTLRCFDLESGVEIWRSSYPIEVRRNHGMSRTVPAVNDRYVVTVGPMCQVMCVERETGRFLWGIDLAREQGSTVPLWYTAQCPLLDGDTVILAPAGKDLFLAVDCASGEVVWRTPNPEGWEMSHSSIMPMTFAGRSAYVYAALGGIAAVAADGENPGELLWQTTQWDKRIVAPAPVQLSSTRLFMTSGHGAGSALLEVADDGRSVRSVETVDKAVLACEQQTPVLLDGHLLGVLPKDAGEFREQLVCWHPERGVVWRSGPERRFGLGPWVVGDGKLFVLDDRGTLTMLRASVAAYEELGRTRIFDGRDAWGPMALVGHRLILRDSTRMVCLDVGRQ